MSVQEILGEIGQPSAGNAHNSFRKYMQELLQDIPVYSHQKKDWAIAQSLSDANIYYSNSIFEPIYIQREFNQVRRVGDEVVGKQFICIIVFIL